MTGTQFQYVFLQLEITSEYTERQVKALLFRYVSFCGNRLSLCVLFFFSEVRKHVLNILQKGCLKRAGSELRLQELCLFKERLKDKNRMQSLAQVCINNMSPVLTAKLGTVVLDKYLGNE